MPYNASNLAAWWATRQHEDAHQWVRVSSEFGEYARQVAQRDDLIGRVEPGMGKGHPGVYDERSATVELDPEVSAPGINPADIHMDTEVGRLAVPALAGVGAHEAGHALRSKWGTHFRNAEEKRLVETALLLEETRMEKCVVAERPQERVLLRAAVDKIIAPSRQPMTTVTHAAHTAALLLARVDAGVLLEAEVEDVEAEVVAVAGVGRLMALRHLWREAHGKDDDDRDGMLALADRWHKLLPADEQGGGDSDGPIILICSMPDHGDGEGDGGEGSEGQSAAAAIAAAVAEKAEDEAEEQVAAAKARDAAAERGKEAREGEAAERAAGIFIKGIPGGRGSHGYGDEGLDGLRAPTVAERAHANQWGKAIQKAQHRDRTKTVVASATPPGRLRTSAAVRRSAQRSMGIPVNAQPWRQTVRRHVENPPLTVGIMCDISGSMHAAAEPTASTAWSLAHAIHQNEGDTATVAYGRRVWPVVKPGERPAKVQTFDATGGTEEFVGACRALDGALNLSSGTGARMLVVVSDGHYRPEQTSGGEKLLKRLTRNGCKVLWLGYEHSDRPMTMPGVEYVRISDASQIGKVVSEAIVKVLKDAVA